MVVEGGKRVSVCCRSLRAFDATDAGVYRFGERAVLHAALDGALRETSHSYRSAHVQHALVDRLRLTGRDWLLQLDFVSRRQASKYLAPPLDKRAARTVSAACHLR